ncbi:putative metal-dependent hydrolase [Mucilaginibacter sp. ZT4R22]|uniref:Metal-dependent hydrolase n=1 Tax=Mucilaginibacter pankratovii TaxID=2772110 RepID=A0ABR7WQT9_9SPHI|nr:putative metal-dependent hydrolase [Mucilaginibacter pankratovii]MBD1364689.1 putative metal-dependent hydrolase [Mucilaginibacter pankratovii]
MTDEQMRYPIGNFVAPVSYIIEDKRKWISELRNLPGKVRNAIMPLTDQQLDTQYRTGGWTLRQVVHHLADSHMNLLLRFKLALTEDNPTIKPYEEADWALLPDYRLPVEPSLRMLEGIHIHIVALLESFTEDQWDKTFYHPGSGDTVTLKKALALYAWHGRHHLAHLTETIKKF